MMGETRRRGPFRREPGRGAGNSWGFLTTAFSWVLVVGLHPSFATAQAPEPASTPVPAADEAAPTAESPDDAAKQGEVQPLSLRYRFGERYTETPDPTRPEWMTQYQVGVREKIKVAREKPQGAPDRAETTLQSIYTERVMKAAPNRTATDVVRRYDRALITTTLPMRRQYQNPKLLEQLSLWYRLKPGKPIELYNLTDGRVLRQVEFDRITRNPFLPQLATLLPTTPRRVGDHWPVPRSSVAVLLGETPLEDGYDVEAELTDVRGSATDAGTMTAVFEVKGQLNVLDGPVAMNARVHFVFAPAKPAQPAVPEPREQAGVIDAEGWISEIRMAEVLTTPLPDDETGRLNQTQTRELIVARRVGPSAMGPEATLPLVAPDAPPDDEAHTWVTYDDPEGRFHLAHPQGLRIARAYPEGGVDLVDRRFDGQDVISIALAAKSGDASQDRLVTDPQEQRKALAEQWRAQGQEVLMGDSGWLKEDVWGPLARKVYRIEAALKPAGAAPAVRGNRIYLDRYIVQFTRNETLIVTAMTTRDPHVPFRDQAESIIKSFTFGPSEPAPGASASPNESTQPSPAP
ncbi:hypothetical protein [Planctomyces sp. SH-PL62]|uniref:hypothetical protein n=1 Tax=Planctomyces sp. SH-PL62 TaxID=1636152 RepID=UPI00078E4767|nr:hypothetical protein [Planctomyces sp. SH-PL62]AMV36391.1 hypothetical protein VT85_03070 [Planctomyces sp. SH-PL62]